MTGPKKPVEAAQSFKNVCLIENSPDGKGIKATAYGNDGKAIATGNAFRKEGLIWDSFMDNMRDLLSTGGKVVGDSYTLGNGPHGATYKDGGIKLDVAAGSCEVTTVDAGQIADKPKQLGVALKGTAFSADPKP